jgi:tetratricopeptide (TPR) repeat protein
LRGTCRKANGTLVEGKDFIAELSLFFLMFFVCGFFSVGCSSVSHRSGGSDFQKQYKQYLGYARIGKAAIKKKEYIKAIELYTKAIEVSPFVPSHYYYRGLAWYRDGTVDKAVEDFDKALVLDSRWRLAYLYRGLCWMKRQDYEKALRDYKRALNLKADEPSVHNNLAWALCNGKG